MKRAMNFCVMALASSTKPSSSRSCTLPRMPDSKAEATRKTSQYVDLFPDTTGRTYSTPAYNLERVSKI